MRSITIRKPFWHDLKIFAIAVIVTGFLGSFCINRCQLKWKREWMRLAKQKGDVQIENTFLNLIKDREGTLFEAISIPSFTAMVASCSSNQVNNVWYVGSENGFDYFIHNSDFMTQRFRVPSGKLHPDYKSPKTSDVYRWKRVSSAPSLAASQIAAFLNGERLPHLAHRY